MRGWRAAILSKASAGPSGHRRPCSQLRSVWTLMPNASAKRTCESPTKRRSEEMSLPDSIFPSVRRRRRLAGMADSKDALLRFRVVRVEESEVFATGFEGLSRLLEGNALLALAREVLGLLPLELGLAHYRSMA